MDRKLNCGRRGWGSNLQRRWREEKHRNTQVTTEPIRQGTLSTPNEALTITKCNLKKIVVCCLSCLQTLDMTTANLQGAPWSALLFVLKICTDTYKIIDKNIPLLTIRLGGKPCERLERGDSRGKGCRGGTLGQWCYSVLASSLASSGASSTYGTEDMK